MTEGTQEARTVLQLVVVRAQEAGTLLPGSNTNAVLSLQMRDMAERGLLESVAHQQIREALTQNSSCPAN